MATVVESATDDKELETVNRLRQLFTHARRAKTDRYDNWYRNYRLVHNRQGGQTSQSWMPSPRDSEIYPTLSSLVAWMTDQHTNIDVTAAADPHSDYSDFMQQVASDLATVLQSCWQVDHYSTQIKMVVWDSFLYGAGYFKTGWDQSLSGGLGNCRLSRVDPYSLYIDPNATSLHDAEYIVEARRMTLDEIERRYPGASDKLKDVGTSDGASLDERPNQSDMTPRGPRANPGSLINASGVFGQSPNTTATGNQRYGWPSKNRNILTPGIVVYEFWVKENDEWTEPSPPKKTPSGEPKPDPILSEDDTLHVAIKWKVCVVAANKVLLEEDAEDLWSHASHPYERYVFEEMGEQYGIAIVDHLAQPQIYINRLLTALQQNAELVGNPIFLESSNSGIARTTVANRPGQRLQINANSIAQGGKPDWLQPPSMPPSVNDLVQFWIGRIENISGLSAAIKGGANSTSRTPEGVVSTIQEATFVRIRSALSNLEDALQRVATKLAGLIVDNYTEPRILAITGPTGQKSALALKQRHFTVPTRKGALPLEYTILIQAGASMPTSRQARVAEADKGYALGTLDRIAWYEAHQYPNWQQVNARILQEMKAGTWQPPGARQKAGRSK